MLELRTAQAASQAGPGQQVPEGSLSLSWYCSVQVTKHQSEDTDLVWEGVLKLGKITLLLRELVLLVQQWWQMLKCSAGPSGLKVGLVPTSWCSVLDR